MRITITLEDPTPEAVKDFAACSVKHGAVLVPDTAWTPERARDYFELLPPRAKEIVLKALHAGGRVPADALRTDGKGLNGHPNGLKSVLAKGADQKPPLWPHGMKQPVVGIGPGYGPVKGYKIRDEDLDAFRKGLAHLLKVNDSVTGAVRADLTPKGEE
ncbi:hypothetical protein ACFVHW_04120 [Streptomyces sp. NPDC127110]|uniref:hypothetical protein n=1 Tax=Streptomyces sp. NPDC127110 TaxID=3345362 RepID=UPI00363CEC49